MCEVRNKHTGFYVLVAILMALTLAKYAFLLNIHKLILTVIVILMSLLGDKDEIFATIMCCIPLHNSINFYVATSVCSVVLVFKYFNEFRFKGHIILVLSMIIWELLHCLDGNIDTVSLITSISPLIVLMIIMSADIKDIKYAFILRMMAVVWIGSCIVQIGYNIMLYDGDVISAFANLQRLGSYLDDDAVQVDVINPNTLGIISILITTGLLQLFSVCKHKKVDFILILSLLFFGMLASSKTFLVSITVMVFLFVIGQSGTLFKKAKILLLIMLIVLVAIGIETLMFPETLEFFLKRLSDSDVTTGRDILMKDYHNYIVNNIEVMLFGVGFNEFGKKVVDIANVSFNVPHNCIQEIVVAWGILGLVMMLLLVVSIIVGSNRYNSHKTVINYIPFIIIVIKSMAGQMFTSGYTILALAFAYLSLCQCFRNNKIIE